MSRNHVQAAAADFARHTKGGEGWALGLAVAACVEPGNGQGRRQPLHDRGKVSINEFATRAGTSDNRVKRYLEAWERAAQAGIVEPAALLTPADWNNAAKLPATETDWSVHYSAGKASEGTRATPENIARQMLENPALAEAAAQGLADGAIEHVDKVTNWKLSKAADRRIEREHVGTQAHPPRLVDRGKTVEQISDDVYWDRVRDALRLLFDLKMRLRRNEAGAVPGDVEILMELLVPETDWDEAARNLIGEMS